MTEKFVSRLLTLEQNKNYLIIQHGYKNCSADPSYEKTSSYVVLYEFMDTIRKRRSQKKTKYSTWPKEV